MTIQTDPMPNDDDRDPARLRADLITAIVLIGLGLVVTYFSWTMDRLEVRRIHPATIPGLVPFILGLALTLCGGLLAARSARLDSKGGGAALVRVLLSWQALRVLTVLVLALVYTLGLVGRMPFWLASALFIFSFIILFETVLSDRPRSLPRTLIWAGVVALAAGLGVHYIFGQIFLVRLP
ncbi:tripartite tricarboxylate transporter TctB family protein [Devosia faecipullorum]|uniref:tripartite tricarboxylate transporter TctB family protein n=1 Tax=Devosia faecipullorum TaxID=2755039 RepID=UPI00187BAF5D|nr:tripartite tricarboxylate transporter TctB family protein [Devosia faecipullorum]MBE7733444.1 tripartite tricarboxylate transporter TctB family protein [Devosia faecipullorum]